MLITDTGAALVAARLTSDVVAFPAFVAFGSDGTAAGAGQTALGAELFRVAATPTQGGSGQENKVTYTGTVTGANLGVPSPNATVTVREAGLFNAASGGTMIGRMTIQAFQFFSSEQELTITVTLSVTN